MKNIYFIISTLILFVFAQSGYSQLSGSVHDFSGESWNTSSEMCIVCHTPHNADNTVSDAPLWNHQVTSQTFTIYSSATFDATNGQPDGSSKLCLSCHDGVTAVDNYGGTTTGTNMVTGTAALGTDISNDHPVSFTYDASLASTDGELKNPATDVSGLGGTIDADMLFSGKMQCASCHDVHNGTGVSHLLLKSNSGSALCITCHTK
ncbi:MAG: cytochrome c3 family protein [Chlorobi bacterium]|nr:cytochrome c3 family protein [Chlorobiota bacterium]